jgi:hypothetical protein
MNNKIDDTRATAERLRDDVGSLLEEFSRGRSWKIETDLIAQATYGSVLVAFAPRADLRDLDADDVAKGVEIGCILFASASSRQPEGTTRNRSGLYTIRDQVEVHAKSGIAELLDGSGTAVESTPIYVIPIPRPRREAISVSIGGVTVSVGEGRACIAWDDPPGTPNGQCHQCCITLAAEK